MYIIRYVATNNDTHEFNTFFLRKDTRIGNNPSSDIIFSEIPENLKKMVNNNYNGVWEPDINSIQVYEVKEVENNG